MIYSVVIPAFNEEPSVGPVYEGVVEAMGGLEGSFEIIFVDDGSTDQTGRRLREIAGLDERVHVIILARNFGKSAAYTAGFDACRGDVVLTLDADLQDDPAEIPKLLAAIDQGADLVVGWKLGRIENEMTKTLSSRVFNLLKRTLFDLRLRDSNSGFRAMRRAVTRRLRLYGDRYRFIPDLAHQQGFCVVEVGVRHQPRRYGKSKYGAGRHWTGLLDLLSVRFTTAFVQKPLHFFGTLGLAPMLLGVGLEIYVLACKLLGHTFQSHLAALIIGVMLILLGFQLIGISLIGEMIAAQHARGLYVVRERIGPLGQE